LNYNNKNFLVEAFSSVIAQTITVDEIIIADDASTDGSQALIKEIASGFEQVTPILREKNLGIASNKDLAIRSASGEYITTLDSDDYYFPQKIEHELYTLMENNVDTVVFSDLNRVDYEGNLINTINFSDFASLAWQDQFKWIILRKGPIPRNLLFSKSLYLKSNGFDSSLPIYEDWDFKIRLITLSHRWSSSNQTGLAYRLHNKGLSKSSLYIHFSSRFKILLKNQKIIYSEIGYVRLSYIFLLEFIRFALKILRNKLKPVSHKL